MDLVKGLLKIEKGGAAKAGTSKIIAQEGEKAVDTLGLVATVMGKEQEIVQVKSFEVLGEIVASENPQILGKGVNQIVKALEEANKEIEGEELNPRNKWKNHKRNHDKWSANLSIVCHDGKLDIFPVYRTVSCSVASDYREGYHPYLINENERVY